METFQIILDFLEKRIEAHNEKIDQAIRDDNHYMKTICKAERSEASIIRDKILNEMK